MIHNYDVAIADIKMPDMSGRQRLREIKEGYPHMVGRVVFLTGDTVTTNTAAFLGRSGCSHLTKPFGLDETRRLVAEKGPISLQEIAVVLAGHEVQGSESVLSMKMASGKG